MKSLPEEVLRVSQLVLCDFLSLFYKPREVTPSSPMGAGYRDDYSDSLSPDKGPFLPLVLCIHTLSLLNIALII